MPPREAVARQARLKMGPWSKGMDQKISPDRIGDGKCAYAQNVLLDEQSEAVLSRQGSVVISTLPSGLSPRDSYNFIKSDGTQYLLVSDGVTLYYTIDPTIQANWTQLITGLTSTGFMEFETAEDKIWFCNGIQAPMSWDGTTLVTYDRTYTNTTDATAVSANGGAGGNATIQHAGLTGATDYWKNMKIVFTVGANIGLTAKITAYNSATNTLTLDQPVTGIATTDRWVLGLQLPIPKYLRFWNDNIFFLNTTANNSEIRFNRRFDPNTGVYINIDHPLAWPSTYQLNIYAQDGDQIWGASPVMRDRFLISKATGLFRLERDSQTIYRIEVITRFVGSRFHRSWGEKAGALYFLGQSKDGLPDVYKSDMVTVTPVDPDGGIEPTLRTLRQPNSVQRSVTLTSAADFNAGTLSTNVKTSGNKLEISPVLPALFSSSNIETKSYAGAQPYDGLLGISDWDVKYDPATKPDLATPAWTSVGGVSSVAGGVGTVSAGYYKGPTALSSSKNAIIVARTSSPSVNTSVSMIALYNGTYQVKLVLLNNSINAVVPYVNDVQVTAPGGGPYLADNGYHTYTIQLLPNGSYTIWYDGVLWLTGTGTATSLNQAVFGTSNNGIGTFKFCYYSVDSTAAIPSTIVLSGNFVSQYDFTRAPDALRRIYTNYLSNKFITPCGSTSASVTVQLDANTDMTQFSAAQVVDFLTVATRVAITNGLGRTIQSVDAANHRITIDAGGGNITTDATVGCYLEGGSLSVQTWSSDSVDFSSGTDPAGYVSVAQGAASTSLVKRYLRVKISVTAIDTAHCPQINSVYNGILWLSAPIFIGSNIAGWGSFVDSITTPAGTDQTIKMRFATVNTSPAESDWGVWHTVANGDNIGTDLGDAGNPPTARWVQFKVEEGSSATGDMPAVSNLPTVTLLTVLWSEGSNKNIPVGAVIRKKRYLCCAASGTSQTNDTIIVSDRADAWVFYTGWKVNGMLHFKGLFLGMSSVDASIISMDINGVYNDQGTAIDAYVDSAEAPFEGDYELRKNLRYAYLHVGRSAYTLTTSYKRPGDTTFTGAINLTIGGDGREVRQSFAMGTSCKRLQRRYRCNTLNQQMILFGETIYYDRRPGTPA